MIFSALWGVVKRQKLIDFKKCPKDRNGLDSSYIANCNYQVSSKTAGGRKHPKRAAAAASGMGNKNEER